MRPPASVASYLRKQAWEPTLRCFYERGNADLEWSHLRMYLEAIGVKADDPNHWGSFCELLIEEKVIEQVGREQAAAASRNGAKNSTYRLTAGMLWYVEQLAAKRGWQVTVPPAESEQTELVR